MLPVIRAELVGQSPETLRAMVAALTAAMPASGLGTPDFAAVLDLSDLGGIEDEVDADTVVTAYAHSIATGDYSLSAHRIGAAGAASLARMAGRTQALRTQFLYPLDVRARLAAATSHDNEFTTADSIGRSLRTHIRILCRAIIGGVADAPADLFDALVAAVRTGALKHDEKGRVAAFAPQFEKHIGALVSDRPLAADLAAALTFIDRQRQEALLAAILETDEPLILAQLLSRSPPNLRSNIERRITALAPIDAGAIRSLPEMQARIDELLTAGAADAAASYMAAEVGLTTWGKPAGRELTRFQNQLRLHFLREDWAAIAATADPNFPAPLEQAAAVETLRQFRGLTALKGPNPNPEWAKTLFAELFAKRPSLSFATNWFAAEISELLQTDSFSLLKGDQIRKGQKAIAEVERMTALLPAASVDEAMECNRALLLLALCEPSQALAVLSAVTFIRLPDTAAAYRTIALARLGRRSEATAALDAAEHTFGRTWVLAAARSHIASGAPFLSVPDISVYDDLVENVASAIARFRTINPADQARVLQRQADPFEALLVDYVRAAADDVVSLVPMMKGVQIDAIEDDLTAFIQHLLAARVQFLGWSVGDQSKGGFSAKGNAGERDLLITWGSSVLALIEAVICDRPLTQDVMKADLESHFQKLFGYGNSRVFFHLTYAYIEDKQGLMLSLETSAEMASPAGFTYFGREPIPHDNSRPSGFVARYSADFGEVKVVLLVLNLGQQRQRQAAKTACRHKGSKGVEKAESTGSKLTTPICTRKQTFPTSRSSHDMTGAPTIKTPAGKLVWLAGTARPSGDRGGSNSRFHSSPAKGWFRRSLPVGVSSGRGPMIEQAAAVQPGQQEQSSCPFPAVRPHHKGAAQLGGLLPDSYPATHLQKRTLFALTAPEHDVRREVCGSGFHHAVAEGREIQALEHRLASSEQDRGKREVQFIDQAGLQILANCRDATSNLDVARSRGVACALERGVDPVRDEVECGAALHYDRLAGMVR